MKIGIFGGSFNPVHKMHIEIGNYLLKQGYVDRVIYVPVGNLYNKRGLASDRDRYEMLKLATMNNQKMMVSTFEFDRLTYTYQTLSYFGEVYPNDEVFFICGGDNLFDFKNWRQWEFIMSNYGILVVGRNGYEIEKIIHEEYSKYQDHIIVVDMPINRISSTEVRNDIYNNEECLLDKVDGKVLKYIRNRELYR